MPYFKLFDIGGFTMDNNANWSEWIEFYKSKFMEAMNGGRDKEMYDNILKPILASEGIKETSPAAIAWEMFIMGFNSGVESWDKVLKQEAV